MKLFWTDQALADLDGIRRYIAKDSEYYALRFIDRIFAAVESLPDFPERGRIVPEVGDPKTRELLFRAYRIVYRLDSKRIVVLNILHGARDYTRRKLKPWMID